MHKPSLVISHLHMPLVMLMVIMGMPFIIMQQLIMLPDIMVQRFCIIPEAISSFVEHMIFIPISVDSIFMEHLGTIIMFIGIVPGIMPGIWPIPITILSMAIEFIAIGFILHLFLPGRSLAF
jgi:hypothetical protein